MSATAWAVASSKFREVPGTGDAGEKDGVIPVTGGGGGGGGGAEFSSNCCWCCCCCS